MRDNLKETVIKKLICHRSDLTSSSSGFFCGLLATFFVFSDSSYILVKKSREDRRRLFSMKRSIKEKLGHNLDRISK